jgi:PKD repeat protein
MDEKMIAMTNDTLVGRNYSGNRVNMVKLCVVSDGFSETKTTTSISMNVLDQAIYLALHHPYTMPQLLFV